VKALFLSSARSWRGGENQFRLIARHLDPQCQVVAGVPDGSDLQKRLSGWLDCRPVRNAGILDFRSAMRIHSLIAHERIDLIHAQTSPSQKTALIGRLGRKVPLVVSRRNDFRISGGWQYQAVDHFFAVSAAVRSELVKGGVSSDKITIVHDAVDSEAHAQAGCNRLGVADNGVLIACVAAMVGHKDHATLLKAWALAERELPDAVLALVGDGDLLESLKQQAKDLPRVIFTGWRNDPLDITHAADIVTMSSSEEGFGSSLCDAQWAGKPVAATRAGGIPEVVNHGETGLISDVGDAEALAQNLVALGKDAAMRRQMGQAAALRARHMFDPVHIAAQHYEVYRSLV
jgi:L-malate glycosyltransferase